MADLRDPPTELPGLRRDRRGRALGPTACPTHREDTELWLAQRTDRTTVATLMRCAWGAVTAIIHRGVAERLDQRRLDTLYRISVDEICYRHPHHYLTIVGDHDTGTVVDVQRGRSEESLTNFFDSQLDPAMEHIEAASMDVSRAYAGATRSLV